MGDIELVDDSQQVKKWYLSKTIWTNLVLGVIVLAVPKAKEVLTPDTLAAIFAVVNIVLRSVSKAKLEIK